MGRNKMKSSVFSYLLKIDEENKNMLDNEKDIIKLEQEIESKQNSILDIKYEMNSRVSTIKKIKNTIITAELSEILNQIAQACGIDISELNYSYFTNMDIRTSHNSVYARNYKKEYDENKNKKDWENYITIKVEIPTGDKKTSRYEKFEVVVRNFDIQKDGRPFIDHTHAEEFESGIFNDIKVIIDDPAQIIVHASLESLVYEIPRHGTTPRNLSCESMLKASDIYNAKNNIEPIM
jgi:hypothetical protein